MSSTNDEPKKPRLELKPAIATELVDHVEVAYEAVLGGGEMSLGRLGALQSGDVVSLDRSPADPVDIRVNGKTIARGEIVTVDDHFAIRLTQIG